jgi:hypothetical protein
MKYIYEFITGDVIVRTQPSKQFENYNNLKN